MAVLILVGLVSASPAPKVLPVYRPPDPTPVTGPVRLVGNPPPRPVPVKLTVASIGVNNVTVEAVDLDPENRVAAPINPWDVSWYEQGSAPGEPGTAAIFGHRDWWGIGRTVFYNLGLVSAGDLVQVTMSDGRTLNFRVESPPVVFVGETDRPPEVFATTGPSKVALITCADPWDAARQTYTRRAIVYADLVP